MSFYLATDPPGCPAAPDREAVCIISRSLSIIVATGETPLCATSHEGRIPRRRLTSERKASRAALIRLSEEDGGLLLPVHGEDLAFDYVGAEAEARAARRGIWQEDTQAPWDYREDHWARAAAASPREVCPIKGNISASGERIYHTPWSRFYDRTKIDVSAGERWFCDEVEAVQAGWRPPRSR